MKKLPLSINKSGFHLKQIKREGMVAIYEQTLDNGKLIGYEVIEIKERKETILNGRKIAAHEKYPADSEWGRTGWSFMTMEKAEKHFNVLLTRIKER